MDAKEEELRSVAARLAMKLAQAELDKTHLEYANEKLRSQLAGIENRIKELEKGHADDLSGSEVSSTERPANGASDWRPEGANHPHDGGVSSRNGEDVP